tara:strand:+ start:12565 stop:12801 length:237 start_codon:yes stop_codon:yes gene_type:complete
MSKKLFEILGFGFGVRFYRIGKRQFNALIINRLILLDTVQSAILLLFFQFSEAEVLEPFNTDKTLKIYQEIMVGIKTN